ncbi:Oocyte-expressed protein-like protein [Sciurus carolinensis]|uniref:Oocyte-expressed protein-like protein n=1 Tax=Sciurus carolinensis TaxID=30640 RepID=A0AA41NFN2_SCICA|nr:Oocyte-expressed protein-like protein [Sciurus carolinensis]
MAGHSGAAEASEPSGGKGMTVHSPEKLLGHPIRTTDSRRPWWFPAQTLSALRCSTWMLGWWMQWFGPGPSIVPQMEWMSQAWLRVDTRDTRNLVEITVFGSPCIWNLVKSIRSPEPDILLLRIW